MKVQGQLESATFEVLASAPAANTAGRFWLDSTLSKPFIDLGSQKLAFLLDTGTLTIGTSGTPANNTRLHRSGSGILQLVPGNDVTLEGSSATTLNQLSARLENFTSGTLPAFGNTGRLIYATDYEELMVDTGLLFKKIIPLTTKGDLLTRDVTSLIRFPVGANGLFLRADSTTAEGMVWASPTGAYQSATKTANYTLTANDDVIEVDATAGGFNITLPSAASVANKRYVVKRSDSVMANVVTIVGTIDGFSSWKFHTQYESYEFYSNGTAYKMIEHRTATQPTAAASTPFIYSLATWTWQTVADVAGSLQNKYLLFQTVDGSGNLISRYAWFNVGGLGIDPALPGRTGTPVPIATNATANQVATALNTAMNGLADTNSTVSTNTVTVTAVNHGEVAAPTSGTTTFTTTNNTNVVKGAISIDEYQWTRQGRFAVFRLRYKHNALGGAGPAGNIYLFKLPTDLTAKIANTGSTRSVTIGVEQYCRVLPGNASGYYSSIIQYYPYMFDSTHVAFIVNYALTTQGFFGAGGIAFSQANLSLGGEFRIEIVDWTD